MRNGRIGILIWGGWFAGLIVVSSGVIWFGGDPLSINLTDRLTPPGWAYWLGTDEIGRSVLDRLSYGALQSLAITALATIGSITIGGLLGFLAGWYNRWPDLFISGAISFFWSIPVALFAILVLTITGTHIWSIVAVISGVNWVTSARIFRAEVRRLRHEQFVRAARSLGFSTRYILTWEIAPNLYPTAVVLLGLGAIEALSLETGLAYLGMSLPPPAPSWGGMMNEGLSYLSAAWWIATMPALVMAITLASWRELTLRLTSLADQ